MIPAHRRVKGRAEAALCLLHYYACTRKCPKVKHFGAILHRFCVTHFGEIWQEISQHFSTHSGHIVGIVICYWGRIVSNDYNCLFSESRRNRHQSRIDGSKQGNLNRQLKAKKIIHVSRAEGVGDKGSSRTCSPQARFDHGRAASAKGLTHGGSSIQRHPLKDGPTPPLPTVEVDGRGPLKPFPPGDQVWFWCLDQQTVMIAHQNEGVNAPAGTQTRFFKRGKRSAPVLFLPKDRFPAISAIQDVAHNSSVFDTQFSRHAPPERISSL